MEGNMKSFLMYIVLLLPLLLLSITPEGVSGKTLMCYYQGIFSEDEEKCEGNDVVCITAVSKDDKNIAVYKTCGERNKAISDCESIAKSYNGICKEPCATDLCNNEWFPYGQPQGGYDS